MHGKNINPVQVTHSSSCWGPHLKQVFGGDDILLYHRPSINTRFLHELAESRKPRYCSSTSPTKAQVRVRNMACTSFIKLGHRRSCRLFNATTACRTHAQQRVNHAIKYFLVTSITLRSPLLLAMVSGAKFNKPRSLYSVKGRLTMQNEGNIARSQFCNNENEMMQTYEHSVRQAMVIGKRTQQLLTVRARILSFSSMRQSNKSKFDRTSAFRAMGSLKRGYSEAFQGVAAIKVFFELIDRRASPGLGRIPFGRESMISSS